MTVEVSVLKNAEKIAESIDNLADAIDGGDLQPATADTLGGVKIGEGISVTSDGTISASGGSGTYMFSMWNVDSTGAMATNGDYAAARASLADGRPIVPVLYAWNFDRSYPTFDNSIILSQQLTENSIKLYYSETEGFEWDADGITAFIDQ